ncbi:hypothetical protein BpHYR1_002241 [Brachionus plicatilis]|uniref:Uncharacterized protein n=1 Tax=Brachionus plicatilis TaxID=10195 RepID=A0A3M7SEG9_BRAPC|nr:hypothetical protein BpHYR1_002241 [Brachionus plicatilis]
MSLLAVFLVSQKFSSSIIQCIFQGIPIPFIDFGLIEIFRNFTVPTIGVFSNYFGFLNQYVRGLKFTD